MPMKRHFRCAAFGLIFCMLLAGCSAPFDFGAASSAVTKFHARLNSQDYVSIYNDSDKRFRDAVKQDKWVALATAIHDKLGSVSGTMRKGFHVNYSFGGSTVDIAYSTKFTLGDAQEEFLWAKDSEGFRLLRYQINSDALVAK
jgi:hypothetical protein